MRMIPAALAALLAAQLAHAEAFRWVDESGGVHYGDSPPESMAGEVTELDVYECNTLACVERESLRAEQAREEVRRLEESFAQRPAAAVSSSRSSYVNTIVREVYVTPFAVPAFRHPRPVPHVTHRRGTHRGFSAGVSFGGRHGTGASAHRGGSSARRGSSTMSMPRY